MIVNVTPIAKLNLYSTPCAIAAVVKFIRPAPQALVRWEGVLKDDSGEAIFSVWKDSGIKKLRPGRRYLFYRVELGRREGRTEVRLQRGARVLAADTDKALEKLLSLLRRGEEKERRRLSRRIKITPRDRSRREPVFFRVAVTAGVLIVLISAALVLSGVVTEEKIRRWFVSRDEPPPDADSGSIHLPGRILSIRADGSLSVEVNGENWTVHFLGIELPPRSLDPDIFDPLVERIYAYLNFSLEGREVRLEMERWLLPEEEEAWAYVFVGDSLVNADLLRRGFARSRPAPRPLTHGETMSSAEEAGRRRGFGVWSN